MRILIWTDAYHPDIGGLEVFCLQLARGMVRRGHQVEVITNRRNDSPLEALRHEDIPVHGFRFTEAINAGDLPLIRRQSEACAAILDRFNPHIIHLDIVLISIFHFNLQQRRRRWACVWTLHDVYLFEREPQSRLASEALKKVDGLVAISDFVRTTVLQRQPDLAGRMETILNALPLPARAPTPVPDNHQILVFGRVVPEKGFDTAIRAFAKIAGEFPEAALTIAGDGPDREKLEALAASTGFAARIHFTGWVDPGKIDELIARHALVVMPPRWQEPFGLVALQTAQAGRPIVATRSGAIPEIVVDNVTGMVVPIDGAEEMALALAKLLLQPALRQQWGEAAFRRARDYFDFEIFLAKHEEALLRHASLA